MSDSNLFLASIPPMPDEEYQACSYPFQAFRPFNHDGEVSDPFLGWITVKGLVPELSFKIKPVWRGTPADNRLAGYLVSANLSCATGHNIMLKNGVPRAVEIALLQLKSWLKDQGCTYLGLDKLDLEQVTLHEVGPTFLNQLPSMEEARAARRAVGAAMKIRNTRSVDGKARRKKAFDIGDGDDDKVYLRDRRTDVGGYVKDRDSEIDHIFPSDQVRDAIFDDGERMLRMEPVLKGAWLRDNKLTTVESWRMYGDDKQYRLAYAVIRAQLRLDAGLRARKPKERDIAELAPLDQEVLRWHLDSDKRHQARNHPAIKAKPTKLARQQYFSAMKRRIWRRLRVDISVPWSAQAAAASVKLNALLQYPGMYEPPEHLRPYVFGPEMAAQLIHTLKVRLDAGRPKGIGRTHVPPELREPPVVPLGQIVLQAGVREFLDGAGMPLYPFLEAHKAGVFGDLSRDEILAATEAAAAGQAVQSRYKVGDGWVIVRTCSRAQGGNSVTTVRHMF